MSGNPRTLTRILLLFLGSAACGINLAAESTEAPPASMAEVRPTEPNAPNAPNAPTPSLAPNAGNANATGGNEVSSPAATAAAPIEPALFVGAAGRYAIGVDANTPADGTPLAVVDGFNPQLAVFSFYFGKLYAPGGCLSRQHNQGGYLVLRPCDDANVNEWAPYADTTFSRSANNPNYDDWTRAPCPGGTSSSTCFVSTARGFEQRALGARTGQSSANQGAPGVLIHLAADANRCLADDGSATPQVLPCDPTARGQLWDLNAFSGNVSAYGPFRSGQGRCIERPTKAAPAKLVSCALASARNYGWFVQEPGHLGTGGGSGPSGRIYLVYDGAANVVSFSELSGTYAKTPPVWGFGPYPRQLQKKAP